LHDFLDKPTLAENCGDFGLLHNEVNSLHAHRVVEANVSNVVVHSSQQGGHPFLSVARPNTAEAPRSSLSFELWAQPKHLDSAGKVRDVGVNFGVRKPLVSTERSVSVLSSGA